MQRFVWCVEVSYLRRNLVSGVLLVRHPTVVYKHNVAHSNAISLLRTISISHISKHQAIVSRLLQRNYTQVRCYRG